MSASIFTSVERSAQGTAAAEPQARVLLVDDDTHILDGFRIMLRRQRRYWTVETAVGGDEAIARLAERAYDIVITDMRMPDRDGEAVLQRALDRQPGAARVVLSGQTDHRVALRIIGLAHRFIAKPSEANVLRGTIRETARALGRLQPRLRAVAGRVGFLAVTEAARGALGNGPVSTELLSASLVDDPGLSLKALQMVSSAFFGLPRRALGARDAVEVLPPDAIRALVGGALDVPAAPALAHPLCHLPVPGGPLVEVVRRIASDLRVSDAALEACVALAPLGWRAMAALDPEVFGVASQALGQGEAPGLAEEAAFGASAVTVGAAVARVYGLPDEVVGPLANWPRAEDGPALALRLGLHLAYRSLDADLAALVAPLSDRLEGDPRWPAWRELASSAFAGQASGQWSGED